jgi:hypothetical protein
VRVAPIIVGAIAVTVATGAWVVITALGDGTTYHLFPLLVGASGPVFARYAAGDRLNPLEALVSASDGAVGWIVGWAILAGMGEWPSSTVFADQPGGVGGETIVMGLAGGVIGVLYALFRPARR